MDLEDSVHARKKDVARRTVAGWLADRPRGADGESADDETGETWVRVNPDSLAADMEAVVGPGLRGIVLPKAEPGLVARLDDLLTRREHELDLPPGRLVVQAVIETARGLLAAADLASAPRVARLGVGEADLAAELGADLQADPEVLGPLRLQLVVASAAAGIAAPVGPASIDFTTLGRCAPAPNACCGWAFAAGPRSTPRSWPASTRSSPRPPSRWPGPAR